MLSSIHPLGERARHNRWSVTAAAYMIGSIAGGALLGAAAGAVGQLTGPPLTGSGVIATAAIAVVLVVELRAPGRRLPGPSRQVNEDWLVRYRGWVYGGGFGFQLGAGVLTQVTTAAVYGWIVLAALSGRVAAGALVGGLYGLVRAAPILLVVGVSQPEELRRFHIRFQRILALGRWR